MTRLTDRVDQAAAGVLFRAPATFGLPTGQQTRRPTNLRLKACFSKLFVAAVTVVVDILL